MKSQSTKSQAILTLRILAVAACCAVAFAAHPAQTALSANAQASSAQTPSSSAAAAPANGATSLPVPPDEIIRRFAQHESDFKIARGNYTYNQSVLVEEAEPDGGQYRLDSEIVFTPEGKRYQHDTYAPVPTLQMIQLTEEDKTDLEDIQPFVLTTEDLPKYNVDFVRQEKVDELNTYVFEVGPKKIEKGQRYFQGTVWVEAHDFAVVKTDGKAVPDSKNNKFPRFVTYRENIEANFWFPTYTHADDELHFSGGDIRIRMTVRYKNYKRFGSTIKLGESRQIDLPPGSAQPSTQQPPQK